MINLISEIKKKEIAKEGIARLFVIVFFMIFAVSIFMSALLTPTLLINHAKEKIALKKIEDLKQSEAFLIEQDINKKIKEINTQLSFFSNNNSGFLISENAILSSISEKKPGVSIMAVAYDDKDKKSGSVTIEGLAVDRESLLSFVDALKKVSGFSDVNLPVSDFVKGRDLSFTINLIASI